MLEIIAGIVSVLAVGLFIDGLRRRARRTSREGKA